MASGMSRRLLDTDGRVWVVSALGPPVDDESEGASLVFSTDDAVRRVRSFPQKWIQLSDFDLLALSRGR